MQPGQATLIGKTLGSTVGASIGSVIPGLGTALGGLIGGALGGLFESDPPPLPEYVASLGERESLNNATWINAVDDHTLACFLANPVVFNRVIDCFQLYDVSKLAKRGDLLYVLAKVADRVSLGAGTFTLTNVRSIRETVSTGAEFSAPFTRPKAYLPETPYRLTLSPAFPQYFELAKEVWHRTPGLDVSLVAEAVGTMKLDAAEITSYPGSNYMVYAPMPGHPRYLGVVGMRPGATSRDGRSNNAQSQKDYEALTYFTRAALPVVGDYMISYQHSHRCSIPLTTISGALRGYARAVALTWLSQANASYIIANGPRVNNIVRVLCNYAETAACNDTNKAYWPVVLLRMAQEYDPALIPFIRFALSRTIGTVQGLSITPWLRYTVTAVSNVPAVTASAQIVT